MAESSCRDIGGIELHLWIEHEERPAAAPDMRNFPSKLVLERQLAAPSAAQPITTAASCRPTSVFERVLVGRPKWMDLKPGAESVRSSTFRPPGESASPSPTR